MQHLAVKATVTGTTDLGESRPGAFAETIREWQSVAGSSLCTTTTIPP